MLRRKFLFAGGAAAIAAPVALIVPNAARELPFSTLVGPRAGFFPNVELFTHRGERVRFYDDLIHSRAVLINFMYTSCGENCPAQSFNLARVQELVGERLGRDVFMHSISIKPEEDGVAELARYAARYQPRTGWNFLTGNAGDIEVLRRRLGFWERDPEVDRIKTRHTGLFRYGNERYDRWGACPALQSAQQIADSLIWMAGPLVRATAA